MVSRESYGKRPCSELFKHPRTALTVVEVRPPSASDGESEPVPQCCSRSSERSQIGFGFADVVKKRCLPKIMSPFHSATDFEAVSLIFESLGEESAREVGGKSA